MRLTESLALVGCGDARYTDEYDCNVYAIKVADGTVLIDTGGGRNTAQIISNAEEEFGTPIAALLTHAHADHSQGVPDLQEQSIPTYASPATAELLANGSEKELGLDAAKRSDVYPSSYEFVHTRPHETVEPKTTITIREQSFELIRVGGHASDHICYVTEIDGKTACFVGDTVYPDGSISLLNVPGSSLEAYRHDITRLKNRGIDLLLPGHGLPLLDGGQDAINDAIESLRGMYSPSSKT